ncbi:unannotated protein [freshwater metagenome]|uniref:Unannotated protein n=1 Tax=freshwater metagenome TaxID=449393 RepID=A0A6J7U2P3_9ZZZZ
MENQQIEWGFNMEAMGATGKVTVDDVFVTISHEGSTGLNKLQNRIQQGYKGEKKIAISQISAVQFKSVGGMGKKLSSVYNKTPGLGAINKLAGNTAGATGYIEFVVIGSSENKGRALFGGLNAMASNENAVMFSPDQEEAFNEIREFIENKIRERYTTQPAQQAASVAAPDVAAQINSLKQLLDSGALTEDEFQKAKSKVLGI